MRVLSKSERVLLCLVSLLLAGVSGQRGAGGNCRVAWRLFNQIGPQCTHEP